MCKYMYRGLFAIALAFYGCIGSNSIMSRGMQSRDAIDGDGVPITMDTTLDYIDMSATTVKDLKEFIVPGYEAKVTASQVDNIITNSIRVSTVTETVGNWTWVDGEYKEADDDIKTFGLWYKDGKWHAYVTDILTPKVGQKSIFQTASVEGSESDTSVTMNFSELGWNFTFNRNGDKVLTAYEVEVYTAERDEYTGATKTEKTKLEVEGLKMYKSEPFMAVGHVTNCHYLVVNESDKGNITRFGNAQAAPDAEEILIKSERDSETGKLIGYFVRFKKKDVLGLVYKPDLEGFVTESDLLSFYYPDGSVTSMDQITTNGIEYAVGSDGGAYVVKGEGLTGDVVLPWKVTIGGNEYMVTAIGERAFDVDQYQNYFNSFTAPLTVKNISNYAFYGCDGMSTIYFPSVTNIGNSVFTSCISLTTVSIPSAINIGNFTFTDCPSLTYISFPSVISIGSGAFSDCTALTSISLPSATIIRYSAFSYCGSLKTVYIPSAKNVGNGAFAGCAALRTISVPSATIIEGGAFFQCVNLASIFIPSVTTIEDEAFFECTSLSTVDFGSSSKSSIPTLVSEGAFYEVPTTCKFIIPIGMYNDWIAASGWSRLYAQGYKFEGYASTEQVKDKRDLTNNVAVADSTELTEWEFQCSDSTVLNTLKRSGKLQFDGIAWYLSADYIDGYGMENVIIEAAHDATSLVFKNAYSSENGSVQVTATRSVNLVTKAGESFVTPTFVQAKLGGYASVKEVSTITESMQGKRDLTNNVAVADSEQFTEWVCIDKKTGKIAPKYNVKFITDASSPNGGLWATYYDGSLMGYIEGTSDAVYLDDYESIVATRRKIKITKSGEAYVTLSGVQQLIPESPDLTVYATTTQVESVSISKRDKADNIAETDSNMYTPWKFESADTNVLSALVQNGTTLTYKKGSDGNNQWVYENCPYKIGDRYTLLFNGETQQQDEGTLLIEWPLYMDEDRAEYTTVIARRSNEVATKAGEPYVTTTFVTNSIAPYEAMKRKLDQIAALEPPSSTVRDLITWANAVQSILKGDLMGGDSSISPAAVLSSSNKYYWDKQTETCYRMTVENDYTIMRAVTNVPPTVEVVLALEKELNKETNK